MPTRSRLRWHVAGALAAVLVATLGGPVATSYADPADAPEPTRSIMLIGDSQTMGTAGAWTWRYRLDRHLRDAGVAFDFVGPRSDVYDMATDTVGSDYYLDPDFDQDHWARWGGYTGQMKDEMEEQARWFLPDTYVIMLGFNDLYWLEADPEQLVETLGEMIESARRVTPEAEFVVVEPPTHWFERVAPMAQALPAIEERSTTGSQVVVAETQAGYSPQDTFDNVHPNARGDVKIADAVADALAEVGVGVPWTRRLDVPLGPREPARLSAVAGDQQIRLDFVSAPGVPAELVWVRDLTARNEWRRLPYGVRGSWTATGLTNGHTYAFRLQPVKGHLAGEGVYSNVVRHTPRIAATRIGRARVLSRRAVRVTWWRNARAASYDVMVRRPGRRWWVARKGVRGTALKVGNLRRRTTYDFAVRAREANGVPGVWSRSLRRTTRR